MSSLENINPKDYSAEEYLKMCANSLTYEDYLDFKLIQVNYLPNSQSYLQLCKKAIKNDEELLKYVNCQYLGIEKYIELCKYAINDNVFALNYINSDYFAENNKQKNYLKICQKAVEIAEAGCGYILDSIQVKIFPIKQRQENYFQLCSDCINMGGASLNDVKVDFLNKEDYVNLCQDMIYIMQDYREIEFIKPEFLPEVNKEQIYTELCQETIGNNPNCLNLIKIQHLPEQFQNLNGDDLKNAILNYTPAVSKDLNM